MEKSWSKNVPYVPTKQVKRKPYEVMTHLRAVHSKVISRNCDKCDFETSYARSLRDHIKTTHGRRGQEQCTKCDYKARNFSILAQHMRNKHSTIALVNHVSNVTTGPTVLPVCRIMSRLFTTRWRTSLVPTATSRRATHWACLYTWKQFTWSSATCYAHCVATRHQVSQTSRVT